MESDSKTETVVFFRSPSPKRFFDAVKWQFWVICMLNLCSLI